MTEAASNPAPRLGLPPAATIFTVALIVVLISIAALYQVTQQRWIGARFAPPTDSTTSIVVKKVHNNSPADGVLSVGQKLVAISDGETTIDLDPIILEAPNNLPSYALFNRSVAIQDDIWHILQKAEVRFQTDRGEWLTVRPEAEWPARAVPWAFWLYSPTSSIGIFFALLIWIRKPNEYSSGFMQLVTWHIFLTQNETILIDRELAHPYIYMRLVSALENFGTNLFFPTFMGLFLIYPRRIMSPKIAILIPIVAMLIPLNSSFQWLEIPTHAYMFHFLITASILFAVLFLQWRNSRKFPVSRAILKTTFLWMFIPFSIPFFFFAVPVALGIEPLFSITEGRITVSGVGIGLALGILYHGLFDVDRWLVNTFLWLGGGALVILIDLAIVSLLHLQPVSALSIALLVAGLVYFPLRQQLLVKLLPESGKPIQQLLPEFATQMRGASTPSEFEHRWLEILKNRFTPADTRINAPFNTNDVLLADSGLSLLVPSLSGTEQLKLSGKNNGSRLFNKKDVEFVESLMPLTRMLRNASDKRRCAQIQERSHVMRDLQGTLGKKLQSLVIKAPGKEERSCAHNALSTLNDTVHFSAQQDAIDVNQLVDDWRSEFRDRLRDTGVRPGWRVASNVRSIQLSPIKAMILTNIFRESVTNALKHAQPKTIVVGLLKHGKKLTLSIRNDGEITDPAQWNPCSGLNGMRARIQSVGGEVQLKRSHQKDKEWILIKAVLPVQC